MKQGNDRLSRLLGYLEADPLNPNILQDAVQAAIDAGDMIKAEALNRHLKDVLPGAFQNAYFAAVIAMYRREFAEAARILEALLGENDSPNVRFNLSWSQAMIGEKTEALGLLDERTITEIPSAAMLRVQLVHEAGDFDEAMALACRMLALHPDDLGLNAAIATLAIDVEDIELARQCAGKAGDHPEALAVTALLELQDGDPVTARVLFERSLALREHNPRAWIGRGLSMLLDQDPAAAAHDLDRGAGQFGDHIGSWIAAGWAHLLAGDLDAARQRFERALGIDDSFAESQGSLAVVELMRGNQDAARRRSAVAMRLDRNCFAGALAQALLSSGDPSRSREIIERAMTTPLNDRGLTMASYMTGLTKPTLH